MKINIFAPLLFIWLSGCASSQNATHINFVDHTRSTYAIFEEAAILAHSPAAEPDIIKKESLAFEYPNKNLEKIYRQAVRNTGRQLFNANDQTIFVKTGDIPAEWLRDSAVQVESTYLRFAKDPEVRSLIKAVLERHAKSILVDPYANSFTQNYWVWEEKFELDSLLYPVLLAWKYWKITGDASIFTPNMRRALGVVLNTMEIEQDHEHKSKYRFASDTQKAGVNPVGITGMIWTGFRPSDDPSTYNFLIPVEMMAVEALTAIEEIGKELKDEKMAERALLMRAEVHAGIQKFGIIPGPGGKLIYAYEVDGLGEANIMDDANMPNLLSIPDFGYLDASDPIYKNTREYVLSEQNPYFFRGKFASGLGSPHKNFGMVWPLGLLAEGITATDPAEKSRVLEMLLASDPGDNRLHESFDPSNRTHYTREDFGWPNAFFTRFIAELNSTSTLPKPSNKNLAKIDRGKLLATRSTTIDLDSPDRFIRLRFGIENSAQKNGVPFFQIAFKGNPVFKKSYLGLSLSGLPDFSGFRIAGFKQKYVQETYPIAVGKMSLTRNQYQEALLNLEESQGLRRRLDIIFRIYDDAIAFRYSIPRQPLIHDFAIASELTQFAVDEDPKVYAQTPQSSPTQVERFSLPLLLELPQSNTYVMLGAADITDYGSLNLARSASARDTFEFPMPELAEKSQALINAKAPFSTPWRFAMVSDEIFRLLSSNIISNLSDPPKFNADWVKPGKTLFPLQPDNAANWKILLRDIEFCAENNLEYITLPARAAHLPELLRYAKSHGVKIRLWLDSQELKNGKLRPLFSSYAKRGVSGILLDFSEDESQRSMQLLQKILALAAENHLTIALHGLTSPTGLTRTYPNLLTEAAATISSSAPGRAKTRNPREEVNLAFTRMFAGPLDDYAGLFNPGAYGKVGTLARQIALFIVYENHQPTLSDAPGEYQKRPQAFDFVKNIPANWSDTQMLLGELGKYIVIARKNSVDWYVGGITDQNARNFSIPLDFLGPGQFEYTLIEDADDSLENADHKNIFMKKITSRNDIPVHMVAGGGFAVYFRKIR